MHIAWQKIVPRSTYAPGSKIIDYIFMSKFLMNMVRKYGYLGIREGMVSDHRMCYSYCDMHRFLGGNINKIIPPQMRALKCDYKVWSQIFIYELNEHHKNNAIAKRVQELKEEFEKEGKSNNWYKNIMVLTMKCSVISKVQ